MLKALEINIKKKLFRVKRYRTLAHIQTLYATKFRHLIKIKLLRHFILYITFLFLTTTAYCQLDKGIWIVGGSGSFQSNKRDFIVGQDIVLYKDIDVSLSPSVGYFIIDKLAIGIKPSFSWSKTDYVRTIAGNVSGGKGNNSWLYLGPFGRYYFLKKENNYNIVMDASYSYGIHSNFGSKSGHSNSFKFMAGPEFFFNSSVGIELLIGYSSKREKFYDTNQFGNYYRGFLTTIGFQIHLERDK